MSPRDAHPNTIAVSAGRPPVVPDAPLNAPLTMASAFVAGGDLEYGRYGNPVFEPAESIVGELEGGSALIFSSGTAATAAVLSLVERDCVIVAPRHAYMGSLTQIAAHTHNVRLIDPSDTAASIAAFDGADLVWIESPTNPAMEVADLPVLVQAARQAGALVAVDNTVATPLRQQPLSVGAHIVTHSASKALSGHSDVIAGFTVTNDAELNARLAAHRRNHGAICGALESWLTARGMRTLAVRLDRAEDNTRQLADRLRGHRGVVDVRYPGFSTLLTIELADATVADHATASSRLITHATSLGGVETTWERRRRHSSESLTIPEGLIRLSVGIEHIDDIYADIDQAISAALSQASSLD